MIIPTYPAENISIENLPAARNNGNNKNRMSAKMVRFVDEYLVDLNATAAARRVGYKLPEASGPENLRKPVIQQEIRRRQAEIAEKAEISVEWIIERYKKLANYCIDDFFNNDGSLKPLDQIPKDALYAIGGFKQSRRIIGEGDKKTIVDRITSVELPTKKDVLDSLAKYLGLFEKDNMQRRPIQPVQINVTLSEVD